MNFNESVTLYERCGTVIVSRVSQQSRQNSFRIAVFFYFALFLAMIGIGSSVSAAILPPTPVVLTGNSTPAGGNYSSVSSIPVLNNAGQVAFQAGITGGSSTFGLFTATSGSVQLVALVDTAAPSGGNFNTLSPPIINSNGSLAFSAFLSGGTSSQGIFTGDSNSIQTVALQGTIAPAGGTYAAPLTTGPPFNGAGQVGFISNLTAGSSSQGLFVGTSGSVQTIALQSTTAPSGGNYSSLGNVVLNGTGQVAFRTTLTGGSSTDGIYVGVPGSIQTVAIQSAAAPAGGNYNGFSSNPGLNNLGQVVFRASLTGGTSSSGIFVGTPGSIQAVAISGMQALLEVLILA